MTDTPEAREPREVGDHTQEIRVAMVLVGGVSLAIWMGGLMYEVEQATRARKKDTGIFVSGSPYRKLAELLDVDLQVDVLSGTSAGGINAAAFAVAQCCGGSVRSLQELWFELGSFDRLLRSPYDKVAPSLLRGDEIMLDGLSKGFAALRVAPLKPVPATELFLTTTFLTGEVSSFRDDYGTLVTDVDHHGLFHFRGDDLTNKDMIDIVALAARSTASFPYAFEPSRLPVGEAADAMHPDTQHHLNATSTRYAVDGGVLANRPLGPALDAVLARTSERDVRRVLGYVTPTTSSTAATTAQPQPPLLGQVLKQTAEAALAQSITGELSRLQEHNERVDGNRRTRVHLARLAQPLDDPVLWSDMWQEYRQRWVDQTTRRLLAEATRQLRGVELRAASPPSWAGQLTGVVPVRNWRATLTDAYRGRLTSDPLTLANLNDVLPQLGVAFFESAVQVAVPLVRAGHALGEDESMVAVRSVISARRDSLRDSTGAALTVEATVGKKIAGLGDGVADITPWWTDLAQEWPPPVAPPLLNDAWTALAGQLREVAAVLRQRENTKDDRDIDDARVVAGYLVPVDRATTDEQIALRLAQLVVAEDVLGCSGVVDRKHSEFPSAGLARRGTRGGFGHLKGSVGAIGG